MVNPKFQSCGWIASSAELACQGGLKGRDVVGDGMVGKVLRVNRGDLKWHRVREFTAYGARTQYASASGVRAPIVAMKPLIPVEQRGAGRWMQ